MGLNLVEEGMLESPRKAHSLPIRQLETKPVNGNQVQGHGKESSGHTHQNLRASSRGTNAVDMRNFDITMAPTVLSSNCQPSCHWSQSRSEHL